MKVATKRASGSQWLLAPEEWDFRFAKTEDFEVMCVYEYARSCPWVRPVWESWLDETIHELDEHGSVALPPKPHSVREAIHKYFSAESPIWESTGPEAKVVANRMPTNLRCASLERLVCCTPSFPVRWESLPAQEKTAALSLVRALEPFRDAAQPSWSARHTFTVAVDLDAELDTVVCAFERWLSNKRTNRQQARHASHGPAVTRKKNVGRFAAPRREALSWLGAYRFRQAGITFPQAMNEVARRQQQRPDPRHTKFARLPNTTAMMSPQWSTWFRKAQETMAGMFKPRLFPPDVSLPGPRWTAAGL